VSDFIVLGASTRSPAKCVTVCHVEEASQLAGEIKDCLGNHLTAHLKLMGARGRAEDDEIISLLLSDPNRGPPFRPVQYSSG